jgi:hypothetical protein
MLVSVRRSTSTWTAGLGRVPIAAPIRTGCAVSSVVGPEIAEPCHFDAPRGTAVGIICEVLGAKKPRGTVCRAPGQNS